MGAAPLDTGTDVAVGTAPGVAVPGIAADPTTDMDVGTADGLLADVADFDPTSAWGDDDEATAAIPDRALGAGTSADAHGSATKKRRRKHSRPITRDVPRYCQRRTELETA